MLQKRFKKFNECLDLQQILNNRLIYVQKLFNVFMNYKVGKKT